GFSLRGIRGNWKLYLPLAAGAAAGVALVWKMILGIGTGGSAGFGMKDFTWYQYLFTQFRALFVYLFTFVLPVNLTVDWDFPISNTPTPITSRADSIAPSPNSRKLPHSKPRTAACWWIGPRLTMGPINWMPLWPNCAWQPRSNPPPMYTPRSGGTTPSGPDGT